MAAAAAPRERFNIMTKGVSALGLDIVNYGFFDAVATERAATDVQFMAALGDDWMAYHQDDGLAGGERRVTEDAKDIGLRGGLFVPMASPLALLAGGGPGPGGGDGRRRFQGHAGQARHRPSRVHKWDDGIFPRVDQRPSSKLRLSPS
jgi:hypothetical protein